VRAAKELLGALTIGRGSAQPRGGGGGSQRSLIGLPSRTKTAQNGRFPVLIDFKNAKNAVFFT
jgi:hypothetical protein